MSTCGHVTVERTKDENNKDDLGYGYDRYSFEWVRVKVKGPSQIVDVIKTGAVDVSFGYPDPPDVCRVWVPYWISDYQTLVNLCTIIESAGFERAPEVDVSELELLAAAETAVRYGLGHGLKNWVKKMTEAEYRGMLEHCAICCGRASSFLCGECQQALAAMDNKGCSKCEPDPERMFDCNCGTNDSYCVSCEAYMVCPHCACA